MIDYRTTRWLLLVTVAMSIGCGGPFSDPQIVWGKRGVLDGDLMRPRAIAIDREDRIFLVDFTARVQVFDLDGKYIGPTWTTPDFRNGRPSGLGIDKDGNLIVCDSHYHCLRIYSAKGEELRKIGGESGSDPGQFSYISDAVQGSDGCYFISEFGANDRITQLDADGKYLKSWGKKGSEQGEFDRPRALAIGPDDLLYVADACNHRIQVFKKTGEFVRCWGQVGDKAGELSYPYDLAFGPNGELFVAEYGNNRVQQFTADGVSKGTWGSPGRKPGQLASPWALAVDRRGRVHVVDTENHRVQRIRF